MATRTDIHTRFGGLIQATGLRASAGRSAGVAVRVRTEGNPKSLAERWRA